MFAVQVRVQLFHCRLVVEIGALLKGLAAGCRIVTENVQTVGGIVVDMLAGEGEDRVHEPFMSNRNWHDHVLEGVLVLAFHGQYVAELLVVVLPEDAVFDGLQAVEDGLHGDGRE